MGWACHLNLSMTMLASHPIPIYNKALRVTRFPWNSLQDIPTITSFGKTWDICESSLSALSIFWLKVCGWFRQSVCEQALHSLEVSLNRWHLTSFYRFLQPLLGSASISWWNTHNPASFPCWKKWLAYDGQYACEILSRLSHHGSIRAICSKRVPIHVLRLEIPAMSVSGQ